ncbi:hypothetical protein ABK040_006671 [Willaertia magna]
MFPSDINNSTLEKESLVENSLYFLSIIYWVIGISLYCMRFVSKDFHDLFQYGRFSNVDCQQDKKQSSMLKLFMFPIISEPYHWRIIYTVGFILISFYLLFNYPSLEILKIIIIVLYQLQLLRRIIEVCWKQPWVTPYRKVGFLLFGSGVSYYLFSSISLILSVRNSTIEIIPFLIGFILFTYSWYHQYNCHVILYQLAKEKNNYNKGYQIPNGDLFQYVYCPHYFTEILIYLSLNIILQFQQVSLLLCLLFTMLNLIYHSLETREWYKLKFSQLPTNRKAIIPFIL